MTQSATSFLRVHRGDDSNSSSTSPLSSTDGFWTAFSSATGWRLDSNHPKDGDNVLPAVDLKSSLGDDHEVAPPVPKESAAELACQAAAMADEMRRLHGVVRQQEVALAAHCVAEISSGESEHISDRVHQAIQQALDATGFQSAAIYLLDDDTEYMHTRAVVGLPADRLGAEPRPLRGSRGDLEAMVQDAVLIDDSGDAAPDTWNIPEKCGAAVCTAILRGDLPVGTLWLFSDQPRRLTGSHAAVARLASARITLELSAAVKSRSDHRKQASHGAMREMAEWQYSSLPVGNQLAPGWFVDGMIESPNAWSIGWHHWDVLPDGSLVIAMAEAVDHQASGAMIAATTRAALTAHAGYRHTALQIMRRICDTLWQTNSADQLISMVYARLDPESGAGEIVAAGGISGLISGTYGYRPLIRSDEAPLGTTFELTCTESTFQLRDHESLLLYGPGLGGDGVGQSLLGNTLKAAINEQQSPLTLIRREIAGHPIGNERGLLSLTRRCEGN